LLFTFDMTRLAMFIWLTMLPGRLWNRVLNLVFSKIYGKRVRIIWQDAKLLGIDSIRIGQDFISGRGLWLETIGDGQLIIGDNVNVSDWVHIGALSSVTIGNGCLMGSKVLITDHSHGTVADIQLEAPVRPAARPLYSKGPVVLEENVWLGDSVVVLPGVRIGRNAIVGANSVVTHNIPDNTVWAGVPAIQIGALPT
jgi:lipopolysaccharide O-acetyltransferase